MPRKARIEYAGAVYHLLNRGNYRQDLFAVSGSAEAFGRALFDGGRDKGSDFFFTCLQLPVLSDIIKGL